MKDVTLALRAVASGESGASARLMALVYDELRRVAAGKLAAERRGGTLQATALVHEAWLNLGGDEQPSWQNRAHFFGAAAEAMRRILIGQARRRNALRRGSGVAALNVDDVEILAPAVDARVFALSDALDRLARTHPEHAELVKLRYFVGLTIEEAAAALGISHATAKRWWLYARAWLHREIGS